MCLTKWANLNADQKWNHLFRTKLFWHYFFVVVVGFIHFDIKLFATSRSSLASSFFEFIFLLLLVGRSTSFANKPNYRQVVTVHRIRHYLICSWPLCLLYVWMALTPSSVLHLSKWRAWVCKRSVTLITIIIGSHITCVLF